MTELTPEERRGIAELGDRLFELYHAWQGSEYTEARAMGSRMAETLGSYLACVAEDGRFDEETLGGLIENIKRTLGGA